MILVVLDNQNTKNEVTKICNEPGIHHIFVAFSECMNFQIEGSLKKIQIFIYPVKQIQMHTQRCTWTNIKVQKVNRCRRAAKQILSNYISLSYGSYLVILQSRFANNTQKFFFQKRRQMTLWLIDRLTPHKNTNWRVLQRYY